MLVLAACVAALYVFPHIGGHPLPLVHLLDKFEGASLAEVAGNGGVMVQPQDLAFEGWVLGDVDLVVVVREAVHQGDGVRECVASDCVLDLLLDLGI